MRETNFIEQNKKKWQDFEDQIKSSKKDPDKLNNLFIQVLDDLSYSRTFYRFRSVRVYLNNLAQDLFLNIYKNKKSRFSKFTSFFKEELPLLVYRSRREFLVSFVVFIVSALIGIISTKYDPEFPRVILGDSYIAMTESNIAKGDPLAVYKSSEEMSMFMAIAFNNLRVSVIIFLFGLLFSAGTISVMIYNGIMVGTFQYFFYQKGLLIDSALTIWLHGTLEMSCMVIAGAAGITMGNGLVFPGTYTRTQSFMLTARRGVKIMAGIAPIIIFAAFIESFVTRWYLEMPAIIKALLIIASLFFIIGYFVFYARKRGVSPIAQKYNDTKLPPNSTKEIRLDDIKDNSELFKDTLNVYRKMMKRLLTFSFVVGIGYAVISFFLFHHLYAPVISDMDNEYGRNSWERLVEAIFSNAFSTLHDMFNYRVSRAIIILNVPMLTLIFTFVYYEWKKAVTARSESLFSSFMLKNGFKAFIVSVIINVVYMMGMDNGFFMFLFWLFIPVFMFWFAVAHEDKESVFSGFARAPKLLKAVFGQFLGFFLVVLIITVLSFLLVNSPFTWIYFELIEVAFEFDSETLNLFTYGFSIASTAFSFCFLLPVVVIGMLFMYHNSMEVDGAGTLMKRVLSIGQSQEKK